MTDVQAELSSLNAAYARCIDNGELEAWPSFFFDSCLYKVTTAENHRNGWEAGLIYADSRGMLVDRIASLRRANVFERHGYRHVIGATHVLAEDARGGASSETPFLVVRIMRTGEMDLFAAGRYLDRVERDGDGKLRFRSRIAVCDGCNIDTLLVIPL